MSDRTSSVYIQEVILVPNSVSLIKFIFNFNILVHCMLTLEVVCFTFCKE